MASIIQESLRELSHKGDCTHNDLGATKEPSVWAADHCRLTAHTEHIQASFVPTQEMFADVFTKMLPGPSFRMHRANLGVAEKP
jgi:hypothetical protein